MERHQGKCPLCGALVIVDSDSSAKSLTVHHELPQCAGFEAWLRENMGKSADSVAISVMMEVDS